MTVLRGRDINMWPADGFLEISTRGRRSTLDAIEVAKLRDYLTEWLEANKYLGRGNDARL